MNFLILKINTIQFPGAPVSGSPVSGIMPTPDEIAAKKAAAIAAADAKKKTKLGKAIEGLVQSVLLGHCTQEKFEKLLGDIVECGVSREDAIREVLHRVESAEGLVLGFPADIGTVTTFEELSKDGEQAIKGLFSDSTPQPDHVNEFNPEALGLVEEFYAAVLPIINGCISAATTPSTTPSTRFNQLTSFVLDNVNGVKISGMTVLGPYMGERAQTPFTTWRSKDGTNTQNISTRFVVEFDKTAGYSTALPSDIKATHLTAVNGYLRRVVPGAEKTPTKFVELTVTCEIKGDGSVFARKGTSFPSAIDIEAASAGVEKFLSMKK